MTVVAAFALRPADVTGQMVGVLADSRATPSAGEPVDGVDKLLRLAPRCCAVGCGPDVPLLGAQASACQALARDAEERRRNGSRPASLWEQAGVFFVALRRELQAGRIEKMSSAVVAGFCSDGVPALAQATFKGPSLQLYFYRPKTGEIVSRVLGSRAAAPLLAEALRMDFGRVPGRVDAAMSLLRDVAAAPSISSVGGAPAYGRCLGEGGVFEFPTSEIDGRFFREGNWVDPGAEPVEHLVYDPTVFPELDTRNTVGELFTGGAPRASYLNVAPLIVGYPSLFLDPEPAWVTDDQAPVPQIMGAGDVWLAMQHTPASGMHPAEASIIASYSKTKPSKVKPSEPKKRSR